MKIQISINDELAARLDSFAKDSYLNRSAVCSIALTQYLNANELTKAIRDLSLAVRKIADTQVVDEDTEKQLEDFERLAKLLTGQK